MTTVLENSTDSTNEGDDMGTFLSEMLSNTLLNLTVKVKGKRYTAGTKDFYQVLQILGGAKTVGFVASNLNGPTVRTVERWLSHDSHRMIIGLHEVNFKAL